jgi:hypothetical protein
MTSTVTYLAVPDPDDWPRPRPPAAADLTGTPYNKHTAWKTPARNHQCGLCTATGKAWPRWPDGTPGVATCWDHCHQHGTIRGPLCGYHNNRLRTADQDAHKTPGNVGRTPPDEAAALQQWRDRCPSCASTDADAPADQPAKVVPE